VARVLFAWECGAGLHHLANVEMLLRAIVGEGHTLAVALRDLDHAPLFLSGVPLRYYQAPLMLGEPRAPVTRSDAYVHVLRAVGLGELSELQVRLSAWIGLLEAFRPDLLVCDHAPTALLASQAFPVRRIVAGAGFCVPPATDPLGVLPDVPVSAALLEQLRAEEAALVAVVNEAIRPFGVLPLGSLAELYARSDAQVLLTIPELDPWGPRPSVPYLGTWPGPRQAEPVWPDGTGPRVLVYLSPRDRAPRLLEAIRRLSARVLALGPSPPEEPSTGPDATIRFDARLVDLTRAAEGCDLFVSHGSHSSVCQTLLRGVPQLVVPVYREQELTARRVAASGAGLAAGLESESFEGVLAHALADESLRAGAGRLAEAHRGSDSGQAAERFRTVVRTLLP
jgi:UDP:flavonoid glycosyltransferase YjiC (YdhE family)